MSKKHTKFVHFSVALETLSRGLRPAMFASACLAIPLTSPAQDQSQSILGNAAVSSGIIFDARQHRLKVSVEGQPFASVMEEVERQSGAQISVYGSDYDDLTMDFGYVSLGEGLKRLLKAKSYVMYESEDSLTVWVLSPQGPAVQASELADGLTDEPGYDEKLAAASHSRADRAFPASADMASDVVEMVDAALEDIPELQAAREQLIQHIQEAEIDTRSPHVEMAQTWRKSGISGLLLEQLISQEIQLPAALGAEAVPAEQAKR